MKRSFAFVALLIFSTSVVRAENAASSSAPNKETATPRYMLRGDSTGPDSLDEKKTAEHFTWAALTNHGAASGTQPKIGASSGKSFYDFKDGLPHPYFIAAEK